MARREKGMQGRYRKKTEWGGTGRRQNRAESGRTVQNRAEPGRNKQEQTGSCRNWVDGARCGGAEKEPGKMGLGRARM